MNADDSLSGGDRTMTPRATLTGCPHTGPPSETYGLPIQTDAPALTADAQKNLKKNKNKSVSSCDNIRSIHTQFW